MAASGENRVDGLQEHLHWDPQFTAQVVELARRHGLATDVGRARAQTAMMR